MSVLPFGGIYSPFGYAPRNEPVKLTEVNPLPENAKIADCGDAGRDGYTVLSRASRYTGQRTIVGRPVPQYEGPRMSED
jgi:hypothetical protein